MPCVDMHLRQPQRRVVPEPPYTLAHGGREQEPRDPTSTRTNPSITQVLTDPALETAHDAPHWGCTRKRMSRTAVKSAYMSVTMRGHPLFMDCANMAVPHWSLTHASESRSGSLVSSRFAVSAVQKAVVRGAFGQIQDIAPAREESDEERVAVRMHGVGNNPQ